MSAQEETSRGMEGACCQSMMRKCFNQRGEEGNAAFNFESCEKMMKQFCGTKDGKFDFEACRLKMETLCGSMKKESNDEREN